MALEPLLYPLTFELEEPLAEGLSIHDWFPHPDGRGSYVRLAAVSEDRKQIVVTRSPYNVAKEALEKSWLHGDGFPHCGVCEATQPLDDERARHFPECVIPTILGGEFIVAVVDARG